MEKRNKKIEKAIKEAKKCVKIGEAGSIEKDRDIRMAQARKIDDETAQKMAISVIESDYKRNLNCFKKAQKFLEELKN